MLGRYSSSNSPFAAGLNLRPTTRSNACKLAAVGLQATQTTNLHRYAESRICAIKKNLVLYILQKYN